MCFIKHSIHKQVLTLMDFFTFFEIDEKNKRIFVRGWKYALDAIIIIDSANVQYRVKGQVLFYIFCAPSKKKVSSSLDRNK